MVFSTTLNVLIHPLKMEFSEEEFDLLQIAQSLLLQIKVPKMFCPDVVSMNCFRISLMECTTLVCNVPDNFLFKTRHYFWLNVRCLESFVMLKMFVHLFPS